MSIGSGVVARAYRSAHKGSGVLDVVVAVYDAIVVDLLQAQEARAAGQFDVEFGLLQSASRLTLGLHAALDSRQDAGLKVSLQRFYLTMNFQILAIPRQSDPAAAVARLLRQIRAMRDAWREVLARLPVSSGRAATSLAAVTRDINVIL